MTNALNIQINRLVLAITITFLVADTYPHPQLSPGLIETLGTQIQIGLLELGQK
jgi:hypothetical protein